MQAIQELTHVRACVPSLDRAASMMEGFSPNLWAMLIPADAPGTPTFSS